jgi:hypothetical protein
MANKSLVDKLLEASNKIYKSSLIGSSNYITVNKKIADIIYQIERPGIRKKKIKRY